MGKKIEEAVNRGATIIGCFAFVGMVLSITFNVGSRFIFRVSFDWAEEISYLFFNWAVFMGITVIYRNQGLIAIDILVDHFPLKVQKMVAVFNFTLLSLISSALVIWGSQHAIRGWIRKTTAIGIRYTFLNVTIPLAAAILLAYSIKFLVMTIRDQKLKKTAVEERA